MDRTPLSHIFVIFVFIVNILGPLPLAQADPFILPKPGAMVPLSPAFNPPMLKGIKVYPNNPFKFDFILDPGDQGLKGDNPLENNVKGTVPFKASLSTLSSGKIGAVPESSLNKGLSPFSIKEESTKLIKYFLASLTMPENDLWVNLSPYEKNRIIPQTFGLTEMGRDLLAEDYMLKQITASLIYPEGRVGKEFWKKVYVKAEKEYGTTNIPVNTFNKVWIVPEKAVVYENPQANTAYVVEAKLKVMLAEDYEALNKHIKIAKSRAAGNGMHQRGAESPAAAQKAPAARDGFKSHTLASQIIREVILPTLETEVNNDKNFAPLRQVYNSLILATWYKKKIKDSILAQVYENKQKVAGVGYEKSVVPQSPKRHLKGTVPFKVPSSRLPNEKMGTVPKSSLNKGLSPFSHNDVELIYHRYLQAFKKGVFNYIQEDHDPLAQQPVSRKYFSGGMDLAMHVSSLKTRGMFQIINAQSSLGKKFKHAMAILATSAASFLVVGCQILPQPMPVSVPSQKVKTNDQAMVEQAPRLKRLMKELLAQGLGPDFNRIDFDFSDFEVISMPESLKFKLQLALREALSNALRAQKEGTIKVSVIHEGATARLRISNKTKGGMPWKDLDSMLLPLAEKHQLFVSKTNAAQLRVDFTIADEDRNRYRAFTPVELEAAIKKKDPNLFFTFGVSLSGTGGMGLSMIREYSKLLGADYQLMDDGSKNDEISFDFVFPPTAAVKIVDQGQLSQLTGQKFHVASVKVPGRVYEFRVKAEVPSGINSQTLQLQADIATDHGIYPAGLINHIRLQKAAVHMEWVLTFDYQDIWRNLEEASGNHPNLLSALAALAYLGQEHKPHVRVEALEILSRLQKAIKTEYTPQEMWQEFQKDPQLNRIVDIEFQRLQKAGLSLSLDQLIQRPEYQEYFENEIINWKVKKYFDKAPKNIPRNGLAVSMLQFLAKHMPQGAKLQTSIVHEPSLQDLYKGVSVSQTPLVTLFEKGGFRLISSRRDQDGLIQVVFQKDRSITKAPEEGVMKGMKKGGIDFTAGKMDLQTKVKYSENRIKFHLDPVMLGQLRQAPGFVPVVVNVRPLKDLRGFLGIVNQNA